MPRHSKTFLPVLLVPAMIAIAVVFPLVPGLNQWVRDQMAPQNKTLPRAAEATQVWVNKQSGLYYCLGAKQYGTVKPGSYMIQANALESGYRPILHEPCR
jgi:hypothetical protein